MLYNSGKKYNFKLPNGGATYNSAPFIVAIYDIGLGSDAISNLLANIGVSDSGTGSENVQATVTLSPILDSGTGQDNISMTSNIAVSDAGAGQDSVSLLCQIAVADAATGQDIISGIAKIFFIVDDNNMLQPLNVLVLGDSRNNPFPALKDYSEEIPGRHGEINFGSKLGSGMLELHVASLDGMTPEQKETLKRDIAKYLNPMAGAKNLAFSDDIKKTYTVKFAGKLDPTLYADWLEFTIPFKMASPHITGSFEKKLIGSGTLNNEGNVETSLTIEIAGAITNPSIVIGTDTLSYTGTISAGQTLIIDTEAMTVELDGVNVLQNFTGNLPLMLQPGETSVTANSNSTITFRDRWV